MKTARYLQLVGCRLLLPLADQLRVSGSYAETIFAYHEVLAVCMAAHDGFVLSAREDRISVGFSDAWSARCFAKAVVALDLEVAVCIHAGTLLEQKSPLTRDALFVGLELTQLRELTTLVDAPECWISDQAWRDIVTAADTQISRDGLEPTELKLAGLPTRVYRPPPRPNASATEPEPKPRSLWPVRAHAREWAMFLEQTRDACARNTEFERITHIEVNSDAMFAALEAGILEHPEHVADALIALDWFYARWRSHDRCKAITRDLIASDPDLTARQHLLLDAMSGRHAWHEGGVEAVYERFMEVLQNVKGHQEYVPLLGEMYIRLSTLARMRADLTTARSLANEALLLARDAAIPALECEALYRLGVDHVVSGADNAAGTTLIEAAFEIAQRIKNPQLMLMCLLRLGEVESSEDLATARAYLGEALVLAQRLCAPQYRFEALRHLAHVSVRAWRESDARASLDEALAWALDEDQDYVVCLANLQYAKLELLFGAHTRARLRSARAEQLAEKLSTSVHALDARLVELTALTCEGRVESAYMAANRLRRELARTNTNAGWHGHFVEAIVALLDSRQCAHDPTAHQRALARYETQRARLESSSVNFELTRTLDLLAVVWSPERCEAGDLNGPWLVYNVDDGWFATVAQGKVDVSRYPALQGILAALIEHHDDPETPGLDTFTIFTAGWPGEAINADSMANRVYVSIARLRRLGLRDVLKSDRRGYRLDPSTRVVRFGQLDAE